MLDKQGKLQHAAVVDALVNMDKAQITVTMQLEDTQFLSDAESKDGAVLLT